MFKLKAKSCAHCSYLYSSVLRQLEQSLLKASCGHSCQNSYICDVMLRPVADAWSMLPHPPRGVYLVLLGLAALAGVALLSLREDNAEALEEVVAVPPSRAVSAGKSLVAQGVIGPGDIRLKKCPEVI